MYDQQPYNVLPRQSDPTLVGAWLNAATHYTEDYSAAGDDMVYFGAPVKERCGMTFDGAADYLRRAEADWRSGDSAGTITAWIRLTATGAPQTIFCSSDETSTSRAISCAISPTNVLQFYQRNNDVADVIRGSTVLDSGRWYHVALMSNGTRYFMYVNGQAETLTVFSGADTGDWLAETLSRDNVTIGVWQYTVLANYLNGTAKDVRYHSEPKSADWIRKEYARGVPDDDLVLHCHDGQEDLSRYTHALAHHGGIVFGHDMFFDGIDDRIDCGDIGNLQTISMWVNPETTTEEILLIDAGADIMVNAGVVTYTGLTPVATYVNGVATTALAADRWQHLVCVVQAVDANNFELGTDGVNFGNLSLRDVRVYNAVKSVDWVLNDYRKTRIYY